MRTVGEAAPGRERLDIRESRIHAILVQQLEFPHPRCVDEEGATRQHEELAMRCRMPASTVVRAHIGRRLLVPAEEAIEQRRLAHTRRPDETRRQSLL